MNKRFYVAAVAVALFAVPGITQEVRVKTSGQKVTVRTKSTMPRAVKVTVNGDAVVFVGTQPRMVNGRVMVPLRGVFEPMGAVLNWDAAEQKASATRADKTVECWIGKAFANVDGEQVKLDAPPVLINGRTLVPLRFISEALGADVRWDKAASTVIIRID